MCHTLAGNGTTIAKRSCELQCENGRTLCRQKNCMANQRMCFGIHALAQQSLYNAVTLLTFSCDATLNFPPNVNTCRRGAEHPIYEALLPAFHQQRPMPGALHLKASFVLPATLQAVLIDPSLAVPSRHFLLHLSDGAHLRRAESLSLCIPHITRCLLLKSELSQVQRVPGHVKL